MEEFSPISDILFLIVLVPTTHADDLACTSPRTPTSTIATLMMSLPPRTIGMISLHRRIYRV